MLLGIIFIISVGAIVSPILAEDPIFIFGTQSVSFDTESPSVFTISPVTPKQSPIVIQTTPTSSSWTVEFNVSSPSPTPTSAMVIEFNVSTSQPTYTTPRPTYTTPQPTPSSTIVIGFNVSTSQPTPTSTNDIEENNRIDTKNPYEYKISRNLLEIIKTSPDRNVGVILTIDSEEKDSFTALGIISTICKTLCRIFDFYCSIIYPLLKEYGFLTSAVTNDGHIVGSLRAGDILNLAQNPSILYISEDSGLNEKIFQFQIASRSLNETTNPMIIRNSTLPSITSVPGAKIEIAILSKKTYTATGWKDNLNEASEFICNNYQLPCTIICPLLDLIGMSSFQPTAITSDGFLIGTIDSYEILKLAESNEIIVFKIDDGISKSIISMDYSITSITNQKYSVQTIEPTIPQPVEISVGSVYTKDNLNIKTEFEPIRLFGFLPIPFTKSTTVRIDVLDGGSSQSILLDMNNPETVYLRNFEISKSSESSVKIVESSNRK